MPRADLDKLIEEHLKTKQLYFGWDKKAAVENMDLTMELWKLHPDCETMGELSAKIQREYPGERRLAELIRLSKAEGKAAEVQE
jgi:hypothetical protein